MIQRLRLRKFKGVVEGEAELDKLTILVGPNNSGKTTILEALFLTPNPFRQVPYVPEIAVQLLAELHKTFQTEGYSFLLNRYIAEKAVIECDGKEIIFLNDNGRISVYTNYTIPGYPLTRVGERELLTLGELYYSGQANGFTGLPVTPNSLLFSTKLASYAHEYLRLKWMDFVNSRATAMVAKDVSQFVHEDYVNITIEPFVGGAPSLFAMLSDGARIRLSDLGSGVHLYIVNRLLYEHYKPEVVLWDDLETHLNPRLLSHVAEWFADLVEEGKQVIVSTHSLEVVEKIIKYVEDATVLLTSLRDGKLKVRRVKPAELEDWAKAGIDPRYAEVFLL